MTLTAFCKFVLIPKRLKAMYNVTKTQISYNRRHQRDCEASRASPLPYLTLSERKIPWKSGEKETDRIFFG